MTRRLGEANNMIRKYATEPRARQQEGLGTCYGWSHRCSTP